MVWDLLRKGRGGWLLGEVVSMYICMDECMNVSLCAWFYQVLYVLLLFVVSSRLYRSFIRSFVRSFVGFLQVSQAAADAVKVTWPSEPPTIYKIPQTLLQPHSILPDPKMPRHRPLIPYRQLRNTHRPRTGQDMFTRRRHFPSHILRNFLRHLLWRSALGG